MNKTTQKQLLDKYSHLFAGEGTPFGAWGFETPDGWNELVEKLLVELDEYGMKNKVEIKILQLKSKFSLIRCYTPPQLHAPRDSSLITNHFSLSPA